MAGCARRVGLRGHPLTVAAALAAWLGAAAIVLSDGRRGLAAGIALVAAGLTTMAWAGGEWLGGAFLLCGGAVSTIQLLRAGPQDWGLMPPGSTPRLTLAVVAGIVSLWISASVTNGPGAELRFATLAVLGLMAGRLLQSPQATPVLTAASGLALALAGASAMGPSAPGPAPYVVAGLIAGGVSFLRVRAPRGA